jgi:hypothetical protein
VILIFATLPGTTSWGLSLCRTKTDLNKILAANYATEEKKIYRVIYFGGDTIQNVSYSTTDRKKQEMKGFFRDPQTTYTKIGHKKKNNVVNDLGIVTLKRKIGPNGKKTKEFETIRRPISELINDAVKITKPTKEQPLVIFSTQCRGTSNDEIYEKCYQQDVQACRRLGKDIPEKIPKNVMKTISMGHHFLSRNHTRYSKRTEMRQSKKKYDVKSYTPY